MAVVIGSKTGYFKTFGARAFLMICLSLFKFIFDFPGVASITFYQTNLHMTVVLNYCKATVAITGYS